MPFSDIINEKEFRFFPQQLLIIKEGSLSDKGFESLIGITFFKIYILHDRVRFLVSSLFCCPYNRIGQDDCH